MRLNERIREEIAASVIAAIPQTDYRTKMQDRAQALMASKLPRLIKSAWDDPKLRGFIKTTNVYTCCRYMNVPLTEDADDARRIVEADEEWKVLHAKYDEQARTLSEARDAIQAALRAVSTTEKFVELYPDLEKHIPVKDTVTPKVLARTDVLDKLKAAGLAV